MKKLSLGATVAWDISVQEAVASKRPFIEKEHLFVALLSLDKILLFTPEQLGVNAQDWNALHAEQGVLEEVLGRFKVDRAKLRRDVRSRFGQGNHVHVEKVVHRSEACKAVFARADDLSAGDDHTTSLHLLRVLLEAPGPVIGGALSDRGANSGDLREELMRAAKALPAEKRGDRNEKRAEGQPAERGTPYLDRFGRDLTREAREGRLGPFVGRRKELLAVLQTLARSSKNNPVLVGEAGVGKTAIVEALALRAVQGKDPQVLSGKRLVELNMGALTGGTKLRGEFEERLTQIIEEVRTSPQVLVFIDELHNLMGAGRAEGGLDAANLLKPSLARGDFRCIGATTIAEYRRHIESDPALERRFERIMIPEPTRDETIEMLRGVRSKLEKHHGVRISDRAVEAAVDLSVRFDVDHRLPDKAIDLLDKAGSRTRVPILSMIPGGTIGALDRKGLFEVTEVTIAQVLSEKMGIPLEVIVGSGPGAAGPRILELEPFLKGRIIGQDEAIHRVCQRLRMSYSGVGKREGPLAVFLLLGPTGVGKTELARSMARFLFGRETEMIRIDMSEFMEEHSVSKLIGAPPGYVGYQDEGQLTGRLRTKPHAVVLFDEVEKAHPRVFDLFLQLFDEGRLTDSKGRTVDARNAIFVMTSNLGQHGGGERPIGFGDGGADEGHGDRAAISELRSHFRQELINRIDEVILFRSLGPGEARKILQVMLGEIIDRMKDEHQVTLTLSADAEEQIVRQGYSPRYGVRELKRTVERLILSPLSSLALNGRLKEEKDWRVEQRGEAVSIMPVSPSRK